MAFLNETKLARYTEKLWAQILNKIKPSDWNQNDEAAVDFVKNRTHYEGAPLFDITWDGEIGDRFALDLSAFGFNEGAYLVKMSDNVFTLEELIGSTIEWTNEEGTTILINNSEHCNAYVFPGAFNIRDGAVVIFDAEKVNAAIGVPGVFTNGTYLTKDTSSHISRFYGRSDSKKLDVEKYLPDGYPYVTEPTFNIIWDGDMEGRTVMDVSALGFENIYFAKVSDTVFTIEEVLGGAYFYNSSFGYSHDYITESDINETYPGTFGIYTDIIVVYDQAQLNTALGLPEGYLTNGVYFIANLNVQGYVARFTGKTDVKQLDEKFIPDITIDYDVYSKTEVDDKIANIFPRNVITLTDLETGNTYGISIRSGVITTVCYEDLLSDYQYTSNEDGTYTITGWNGTTNGEASTEIIIPNDSSIYI